MTILLLELDIYTPTQYTFCTVSNWHIGLNICIDLILILSKPFLNILKIVANNFKLNPLTMQDSFTQNVSLLYFQYNPTT
jgi:hypothetical protein